jgi:hypothetical protein
LTLGRRNSSRKRKGQGWNVAQWYSACLHVRGPGFDPSTKKEKTKKKKEEKKKEGTEIVRREVHLLQIQGRDYN